MNAEKLNVLIIAVTSLVQLLKWAGLPRKFGILSVFVCSLFGILMFNASFPETQTNMWENFNSFMLVATASAGVYGFARAAKRNLVKNSNENAT